MKLMGLMTFVLVMWGCHPAPVPSQSLKTEVRDQENGAGLSPVAEVCTTLVECRKLEAQVKEKIDQLMTIGTFVRDANGVIRRDLDKHQAEMACRQLGQRLPSALEVARHSIKYGAQFFFDTANVHQGKAPKGYQRVQVSSFQALSPQDGQEFYFTYFTFPNPTEGLAQVPEIWTRTWAPTARPDAVTFRTSAYIPQSNSFAARFEFASDRVGMAAWCVGTYP